MAKTKATSTYYSRDSAALILFKHLGQRNWHKDLTCTTERTKAHRGYKRSGMVLLPRCMYQGRPYYDMPEIMRFVREMKAAFPELEPSGIKGIQLTVPIKDQRATHGPHGFRLNQAEKA